MKYVYFPEYDIEYYNACTLQYDIAQEGKDKAKAHARRIKEKKYVKKYVKNLVGVEEVYYICR